MDPINQVPQQPVAPQGFQSPMASKPTPAFTTPPSITPGGPGRTTRFGISLIIALVVILIGAGLGFAYFTNMGPFGGGSSYTEGNILSGLLSKAAQIDSSTYTLSGSLKVAEREADAAPFEVKVSNIAEVRQKYQNDSTRMRDISNLLGILQYNYGPADSFGATALGRKTAVPYPKTLKALVADATSKRFLRKPSSIVDPVTNQEYGYEVTEGGNNFALSVNFETSVPAANAQKYASSYGASRGMAVPAIDGNKLTFDKDSTSYIYMSSEPPKPFLVRWSEMLRYVTPDMGGMVSSSVTAERKNDVADWMFNFNAEGTFGDLTYKVNADALKKDADYFFKLNNFPEFFFFSSFSNIKGKWVKISNEATKKSDDDSYYGGNELDYLAKELPELEKEYKENREKFGSFLKRAAEIADELNLISFKDRPNKESVDGRSLTRYELFVHKEAIVPFYEQLSEEVNKNTDYSDFRRWFSDKGLVEYLKSPEFEEVYQYFNSNTEFTLWVDKNGFPAIVQEYLRVVPPNTATQLRGKQVDIIFKLIIDNINESVNIEAPADAIPVENLSDELEANEDYSYDPSGATAIKNDLVKVRSYAEMVYVESGDMYGKTSFKPAACKKQANTLFGNTDIFNAISKAAGGSPSKATCASSGSAYAISVPLPDDPEYSWCIDSLGSSKQIVGKITSLSCK